MRSITGTMMAERASSPTYEKPTLTKGPMLAKVTAAEPIGSIGTV